jgi:protein arginine kinase activator
MGRPRPENRDDASALGIQPSRAPADETGEVSHTMSVFCQKCQKETANVHVTEISKEGGKAELHLCEECAKDQGVPALQSPSVFALFKELMEKTNTVSRTRDRQCPQCGMSFGEFKAKGRFGCAHDYEVFLSRVIPLLERIHGASEHVGEADAASVAKAAAPSGAPVATPTAAAAAATAPQQTASELKRLRRDLQRVIKNEEYEEAARIRDRIQTLERELEGGGAVDG